MVTCVHAALALWLKKLWEITCLWFVIYLWLPSEEYKIVFWKKKKFEDLEDLLLSFRLYFVIVGVSSSLPCTICYYEYMYICGIDLKKLPPLSL
jgi:hypothetical protein